MFTSVFCFTPSHRPFEKADIDGFRRAIQLAPGNGNCKPIAYFLRTNLHASQRRNPSGSE
jgi:hypothetical protein